MKSAMEKIKQVKGIRHDEAGRRLTLVSGIRKNHAEVTLKARPR